MAELRRGYLIWGAGGHGRVVADLVRSAGGEVLGFVDSDPAKLGREVEPGGARVVELQERFLAGAASGADRYPGARHALAVGANHARLGLLHLLGSAEAPPLIHPAAVISASARVGRATVVLAGAVVNAAAEVGRAVIVNTAAVIEHDCSVADGAHVSPGAVLAGGVRVGAGAWVGAGATVLPGVSIGDGAVVGAGAVVLRDVPQGQTVVGNPARTISRTRAP